MAARWSCHTDPRRAGPAQLNWLAPATLKKITGVDVLMQTSTATFIGAAMAPIAVTIQDSASPTEAKTS